MNISSLSAEYRTQILLGTDSCKNEIIQDKSENSKATHVKEAVLISLALIVSTFTKQIAFLSILIVYFLLRKLISYLLKRNSENAFERDYPIFLISLSSSVKCGLDPLTALIQSKDLFEKNTPIFMEIEKFHQQISSGFGELEAVHDFGSKLNIPDLVLFKDAFLLSRQQGVSLSDCLQRIARVVRARQSFRRKSRGAVAMQKLSGFGIVLSIAIVFVIQLSTSHQTLRNAWEDQVGMRLLILAVMLFLLGLFGIIRIGRSNSWRV